MNTRRPTIGNTVALDRFTEAGPSGYAAVYDDGTHGPTRSTREEAEIDYQMDKEEEIEGNGCPECGRSYGPNFTDPCTEH